MYYLKVAYRCAFKVQTSNCVGMDDSNVWLKKNLNLSRFIDWRIGCSFSKENYGRNNIADIDKTG